MELVQLIAQYPAVTVIFIAWPFLFVWLLVWVMRENSRREARLMDANDGWRDALDRMAEKLSHLGQEVEQLKEGLRR